MGYTSGARGYLGGWASLTVATKLEMGSGAQILADYGTAAAPGIAFNGNADIGLYRSATNVTTVAGSVVLGAVTFSSNVVVTEGYIELGQIASPAAPAAGKVRIYNVDNGGTKSQTRALFDTGVAQTTNTEP